MRPEVFVFCLYAFLPCRCQLKKHVAGPYDIVVHYVESCLKNPGPDSINGELKLRKINRTVLALDGSLHCGVPFDDNLSAVIRLDQFRNGAWNQNFFVQDFKNSCSSAMKYVPKVVKNILDAINYKSNTCPIAKGNYTFKNFILQVELPEIPIFFYNKYRYFILLKMKGKTVACFDSEIDVVPKRTKNRG